MATRIRSFKVDYVGLVLIFCIFLIVALRYRPRPIIDDAAISFRYVDSIVAGHGIVYNYPGPHVYGASALPYTLVLSLFHFAGIDSETAALIINVVCLAVTCFLLYRLCITSTELVSARAAGLWALIPCILALSNPTVMVWITQGLESGFHLLLCTIAIWFYEYRKYVGCGLFIAFAVMNKLDAVSLGAAIVVYHTVVYRKPPFRLVCIAIAAYLPWLLFTSLYFGNPLPMSLQAKQLHEFASKGHQFFLNYISNWGVLIPGFAAVFLSRAAFVRILGIWFVFYVLLYDTVAKGGVFPWYFFPSDFTIYYLAGIALAILACRGTLLEANTTALKSGQSVQPYQIIASLQQGTKRRRILSVCAVAFLIWLEVSNLRAALNNLHTWRYRASTIEQDRVDIGMFLREHAAPTESVYSGHGWIQLLSRLRVYDGSGINDPDLVRMTREGRLSMYLSERMPTYLVDHAYIPPANLRDKYTLIARFTRTEHIGLPDWKLWARKDSSVMKSINVSDLPLVFPVSDHGNQAADASNSGKPH